MDLPTIGESLRLNARRFPAAVAVEEDGRTVTYAELNARVNRLTHGLRALGVGAGDVVGILLENRLEHLEAIYASAKLGAIAAPLDVKWGHAELGAMLRFFQPRALILEASLGEHARATEALGDLPTVAVADGPASAPSATADYAALLAAQSDAEPPAVAAEPDIFLLMLTSGTTGLPKACVATQRMYALRCLNYAVAEGVCHDDVFLLTMPLYFNAGRGSALAHLFHGGKVVLLRGFDVAEVLAMAERTRATNLTFVATAADRVLAAPELARTDLSSLRFVRTTGSVLHRTTKEGILQKLTPHLHNAYGTTDTGAVTVLEPVDQLRKHGSVGRPLWGVEVRVVDDDSRDLPAGELGEVVVRGPLICDGYYRNPEATAQAFRADGFHTGDLGRFDDEGYLFLVGRKKDMIKSGGISVFPEEIEELLNAHPAVLENAVIGVADPQWGEAVHAFVVLRPGAELAEADVIAHCRAQLAHYKAPKGVTFLAALPRTENGKIAKERLRAG
jgi:fatty-acyl-CoA synthase